MKKISKDPFYRYRLKDFEVGDRVTLDVGSLHPILVTIVKINDDTVRVRYASDYNRIETFTRESFDGCFPSPF